MICSRNNSLDPVDIEGWRWASFLTEVINSFSSLNPKVVPIPSDFLNKEGSFGSQKNPQKVQTQTWACRTKQLRYVRAACVESSQIASVLNLLIIPSNNFDLPFFGADFVTLASGHLLALDLQPALKKDKLHTELVWQRLKPLHAKWQSLLPEGGPIPKEAEPYFSPGFLWTRLPLGIETDQLIEEVIQPAFREYLTLYLDLLKQAKIVSLDRSSYLLEGQEKYMRYRAYKDPAKGMLTRFYGAEWTEFYINHVLFDL
mgnify:CR=1 FL=1